MQAEDMPGGTVGPHLPDFARPTSGAQALDGPAAGDAAVAEPVVETVGLVLPELDGLWVDPVAAPERRQRHLAVAVARRQLLQPLLQLGPAGDHLALRGCPRSEPRAGRPCPWSPASWRWARSGRPLGPPRTSARTARSGRRRHGPHPEGSALAPSSPGRRSHRGSYFGTGGGPGHGGGPRVSPWGRRTSPRRSAGYSVVIARSMSTFAARRPGRIAASTPATAASRTKATSWPPGTVNSPNPWDASARTMVQPKNTPTAMPRIAPSTEMITASQRIIDRTWARVAPTARSRPSSRTRSNTDRASVFTIPNSAMMIANASRMRTRLSNWSSCLPTCCLYWAMSWTCTFGKSATTLSMAPRTLAASTPGLTSAITIELSWVP